jgi:putative tricarboxylic transport membrane protein
MRYDMIGGLTWFLLGFGYCLGAIKYKLGTFQVPGPGFVPFLAGALLATLGLVLFISNGLKGKPRFEEGLRKKQQARNLLFPLVALLLYALFLEWLGFLLDTFLFLLFLFKMAKPKIWVLPIVLSALIVTVAHFLFSVFLQSQFPKGMWGF